MPKNVNCQCVRQSDHACMHHAATKPWFGRPQCLLVYPAADPRQKGCALQYPYTKPDGYPLGPPSVLRREGSMVELKVPPSQRSMAELLAERETPNGANNRPEGSG